MRRMGADELSAYSLSNVCSVGKFIGLASFGWGRFLARLQTRAKYLKASDPSLAQSCKGVSLKVFVSSLNSRLYARSASTPSLVLDKSNRQSGRMSLTASIPCWTLIFGVIAHGKPASTSCSTVDRPVWRVLALASWGSQSFSMSYPRSFRTSI